MKNILRPLSGQMDVGIKIMKITGLSFYQEAVRDRNE